VRPKTVVDLIGIDKVPRHDRCSSKERSKLNCLVLGKVCHRRDMALRFDDQGAETERTDTVFDEPEVGPMDESAWKISDPI
jgi:hypothetical protein